MNSFKKLTLTSLKMNKKRTIVTIIGIILATALICAVATMAASFRGSLINYEIQKNGNYHYHFFDVPPEDISSINNNRYVKNSYVMSPLGFTKLDNNNNPYKPYIKFWGMDNSAIENANLKLLEGRMPENSDELVISNHIKTNAGIKYKVGDKVTFNVGKRVTKNGEAITDDYLFEDRTEEIINTEPKTYTIVGIVERPSYYLESRDAVYYSVFSYIDDNAITKPSDIYVEFTKQGLKKLPEVVGNILDVPAITIKHMYDYDMTDEDCDNMENARYTFYDNHYLIKYLTYTFSDSLSKTIYFMAAIIITIIIVTSAFCIRNSFAISITEKTKQYGMLASIGATSKQIKRNVYYEAFILAIIGIPLGILLGELASYIVIKVVTRLLKDVLFPLSFNISIIALIFSLLLAIIMIFLSAKKPAKRASRIAPIDAIRETTDIKISEKKIKCPKLIKRLFGAGGVLAYKNMKRNKKRYRIVVISITLSIAIFIGLYYFMNLSFTAVRYYAGEMNYNLSVYSHTSGDKYAALLKYEKDDSVTRSSIQRRFFLATPTKDLKVLQPEYFSDVEELGVCSIGDKEYQRFIDEIGLKYEDVKDKVIIVNDTYDYDEEAHKNVVSEIYSFKPGDTITGDVNTYLEEKNLGSQTLTIAALTNIHPLGFENTYSPYGLFIVSDEWMNAHKDYVTLYVDAYFQSDDPDTLQESIEEDPLLQDVNISNSNKDYKDQQSLFVVIAIFLYGFITVISLIGITNILNTVTTSMELRSKEFAMLRSVGMAHKEFNRMIRLENIFFGGKALLFGLIGGNIISLLFKRALANEIELPFAIPWGGMLISIAAVFLLLACIMRYSLNKVYKQNIIETIRQDNL